MQIFKKFIHRLAQFNFGFRELPHPFLSLHAVTLPQVPQPTAEPPRHPRPEQGAAKGGVAARRWRSCSPAWDQQPH